MKKRSKVISSYAMSGYTSFLHYRRDGWWWELTLDCGHEVTRTQGARRHIDRSKDKEPPKFVYCEECNQAKK